MIQKVVFFPIVFFISPNFPIPSSVGLLLAVSWLPSANDRTNCKLVIMREDLLQRYVTLFSLQTTMINYRLKQTVQYMYIALMFSLVYGFRYDFRWLLCKGSHEPWISGSVHEIHQIHRSWDCSWLRISEVSFTQSDSAREYRRIRKNNRFAYCRGSRLPYANPDSPTTLG